MIVWNADDGPVVDRPMWLDECPNWALWLLAVALCSLALYAFDHPSTWLAASVLLPAATLTPTAAIAVLEDGGYITPRCPVCRDIYAASGQVAARLAADPGWRPATSHVASPHCVRTRQPHCRCHACAVPARGRA